MGAESCPCFPNDTCNASLSCRSNVCVDLGESAGANAMPDSSADAGRISMPQTQMDENPEASGTAGANAAGSSAECMPECGNRQCGSDPVCGDSCGTCEAGRECVSGICKSPQPLKENGATCTSGTECASGTCDKNLVGELHCYGSARSNDVCGDTFDCRGGVCITRALGGSQKVCVDGINTCAALGITGTCTEDLAIASCQFEEYCGNNPGDFNSCIEFGCKYWHENPPSNGCQTQFNFVVSGQLNCQ